ncbi:chondroitin sulfate proteoglycan 5 isoform X3 [Pleurodeles waltl]|uniref:chondroitin sulfate proteoglycan 5 isoform X3 n=1 Tax=Pleurodeles waltl TaxID=8319 RepID=UPI003709BEDA
MGRAVRICRCPPHPLVLAAALTLIILPASRAETATEWKSQPTDATDANDGRWEGHVWLSDLGREAPESAEAFQRSLLSMSPSDQEPLHNGVQEAGNSSVAQGLGKSAPKDEELQSETPVDISASAGSSGTDPTTVAMRSAKSSSLEESTPGYYSTEINKDISEPSVCLSCPREGTMSATNQQTQGALEGLGSVTTHPWSADSEAFVPALSNTKKVARDAEDSEEAGSGDPSASLPESVLTYPDHAGMEHDLGGAREGTTSPTYQSANNGAKGLETAQVGVGISPDSAETDLLLGVYRDGDLSPPTPSGKSTGESIHTAPETDAESDSKGAEKPPDLWAETTMKSRGQGVQGNMDLAFLDKEEHLVTTTPPKTLKSPEPPSDQPAPDIIDTDYYDLFDIDGQGGPDDFRISPIPGVDSTKKLHDTKPSWSLSELYDDFTPFDESDFYPTTSFYADGDEEGANQDEDDEDDIEEGDDGEEEEATARVLEDENGAKPLTFTPKMPTMTKEEKPTGRQHVPQHTFILSGVDVNPKSQPDTNKDLTQMIAGDNGTECRTGYVRFNNSCKSVCDMFPMYCYNSGQCYLVENIGAFCRCNTQDYIWHKGLRCESIITDFQVMCVAVGAAALVVLLLFMMTVFFAKKLYLLKTENYKLRKRNRYRTPSELHNDNFSLSTIAEGSHPNVRKLCDTPCKLSPHARALAYYDNVICQDEQLSQVTQDCNLNRGLVCLHMGCRPVSPAPNIRRTAAAESSS